MADINYPLEEPTPTTRRGLGLGSIILLTGVLLTAVVFGVALARQNQTQPTAGPAPDFTLTTYDGETLRISDLRGKVVIVNFWASWCGPCRLEAPALQNTWERYKDQDVMIIGVAYTDTDIKAQAFMDEFGVTYPNGPDLGTRISDLYHIQGVPETFIIDKNGNISEFIMSRVDETYLDAAIDRALKRS